MFFINLYIPIAVLQSINGGHSLIARTFTGGSFLRTVKEKIESLLKM